MSSRTIRRVLSKIGKMRPVRQSVLDLASFVEDAGSVELSAATLGNIVRVGSDLVASALPDIQDSIRQIVDLGYTTGDDLETLLDAAAVDVTAFKTTVQNDILYDQWLEDPSFDFTIVTNGIGDDFGAYLVAKYGDTQDWTAVDFLDWVENNATITIDSL